MKKLLFLLLAFLSVELAANQSVLPSDSQDSTELLLKKGYYSPELFAAAGNAYYKQNKIGLAILYYERALKLSPNNTDIKDNLELANAKKTDKELAASPSLKNSLNQLNAFISYDQLGWIAILLMILACTLIIITRFRSPEKRKTMMLSGLLLNTIGVVLILFAGYQKQNIEDMKEAIIVSTSVQIHNEPSSTSGVVVTLHEGSKVIISKSEGEWMRVIINEEYSGWIVKSSAQEI
jgi:tetratricopeptide (TPR) repeat protein